MQTEILVLSFISGVLVLFPLPWYCRAGNIAAMSIGIWLFVVNTINAIDALRWTGTYQIPSLIWCDITSALITAVNVAIPAACLCICIHLERMASFCQSSTSITKRRRILLECLICFGVPLVYAALHIIVQPRRFDVYENFGCRSAIYPSVATLFVVWIPPLALSFLTICFCGITWRHFLLHGVQFSRTRTSSSLTSGAYIRLVSMAISEVICTIVATVVAMSFNLSSGLAPWAADFTRDLTEVLSFSSAATPKPITAMLITEWAILIAQSFFFVGLFVLGEEGRSRLYEALQVMRRAFSFCGRRSTCIGELKGTCITERDLTPVPSLTILEFRSATPQSSMTCMCRGCSSEKSLPSSPAASRPPSLDLTGAKQLEESPEFLDPVLLPLESPSGYSAIASSHNSLQSNFDPQQLVLPSTQWPRPPSTVVVRLRPKSSSMNFFHAEGPPFYGSAVPRDYSRNSKNRNTIYMTMVREVQ